MARSIELVSEQASAAATSAGVKRREWVEALESHAVVVLVLLAVLGFGLRIGGISRIGFAEDEINKLEAARAYEQGNITPNAEHPMLMKTLIFVSMRAARAWNDAHVGAAPANNRITDETAVRLPNIILGALTIFPLFLLTASFFERRTALLAAALWAFGINAVTYNRIAKEDTLLVFFMLFAFYFYVRAKQTSGFDAQTKRRNYILSGISFALMLASKYFPHYFGLNMLYHHFVHVRGEREPGEPRGGTPWIFYLVVAVAFIVANPSLLLPQTWQYLSAYSSEGLLTHRGYLMGATLYDNLMSKTPFGGTPVYFYLLFMLIKMPLPLLVAFGVGLIEIVRRRKEAGAAFLLLMSVLWIVPYSLAGAKWLRYTLSLLPFVYMTAAVGIVALVRWCARLKQGAATSLSRVSTPWPHVVWGAAAVFVFVALPAWTAYAHNPHYALYTNALAANRAGYYFPHDEFYDDGLREAVNFICERAPVGATVAHETPGVVRYYLQRCGRTDLRSRTISDVQYNPLDAPTDTFVIMQRGRTYFENREELESVRASDAFERVYDGRISGASAVEIYASATRKPSV
ncbi:MAG TPA: glycosyltransferase family 39 protein [Pyrinomonadaceae bacterium]